MHLTTSRVCYETGSLTVYRYRPGREIHTLQHPHLHLNSSCFFWGGKTISSIANVQTHADTHTHTQRCQAKEEGGLLRTFKQKDIFRKVLLSEETKGGSDMTSHRRESEGHRSRLWNSLTHTHSHAHFTHTHLINTVKVLCAALKIAVSSSPYLFADIRIVRMFCIRALFPSAESTRYPPCFIEGCFDYLS